MPTVTTENNKYGITVRHATLADAAFLARIDQIAASVPFERSLWDDLLEPLSVSPHTFVEAMFRLNASNWGRTEEFIVLEKDGQPVAACVVFEPPQVQEDRRPLRLEKLADIATHLSWSDSMMEEFQQRYDAIWGSGNIPFLAPQAPVIIESVGVVPEARGLGLGKRLMQEAFAEARQRGHDTIGIMVIHGNDIARSLYESSGFEPYITYHANYFDYGFPGVTKYRVSLKS